MLKRPIRWIYRFVLWATAVFLFLLILSQIALFSAVVWLNSSSGNAYLSNRLDQVMMRSGYKINFAKFHYRPVSAISVTALNIRDEDGPILKANEVALKLSATALAYHTLALGLYGENVQVYRIPKGRDREEAKAEFKLAIPDIYIDRIVIDDISLNELFLAESVIGPPALLDIKLSGNADLAAAHPALKLNAGIKQLQEAPIGWLPEETEIDIALLEDENIIRIDSLALQNAFYSFTAEGDTGLVKGAPVDLKAEVEINDMSAFAASESGTMALTLTAKTEDGSVKVESNGTLDLARFEQADMAPLSFELTARDVYKAAAGAVKLSSIYKERPVSLTSNFTAEGDVLHLTDINGTAPSVNIDGALDINRQTRLIDGALAASIKDLSLYSDLIQKPVAGSVTAKTTFSNNERLQTLNGEVTWLNGGIDGARVDRAILKTTFVDLKEKLPQTLSLQIDNALKNDLKITHLSLDMKNSGEINLKSNLEIGAPIALNGTAKLNGKALNDMRLTATNAGGSITLSGDLGEEEVDIAFKANKVPLNTFAARLPERYPLVLSGQADLKGALASPSGNYAFELDPIEIGARERGEIKLSMDGSYGGGKLTTNVLGSGTGVQALSAKGTIPFGLSLKPFKVGVLESAPMNGEIVADLNAGRLAAAFLPPDHDFSGHLDLRATFTGTPEKPHISGTLDINDGYYNHEKYGVQMQDIRLNGAMTGKNINIKTLQASDGEGGILSGGGTVDLSTTPPRANLSLSSNDMHLLKGDMMDGRISTNLSFTGGGKRYLLEGDVGVNELSIAIPEQFNRSIPQLNILDEEALRREENGEPEDSTQVALDIMVDANDRIFVRGWGLDAEMGGQLDIQGTVRKPRIIGSLLTRRGRLNEFGKTFELEESGVHFNGESPPKPSLDVRAVTEVEDITAEIILSGPVKDPNISLRSVPSLPEDEILSRVLFGKDINAISPFQAVQLAQTMQRFRGRGGGFDPIGELREMTGLDDIRIDSEDDGSTTFGAGKYLTEDVYIEFEQGSEAGSSGANLQIEVSPSITVESEIGSDANAGGGVFWEWDY